MMDVKEDLLLWFTKSLPLKLSTKVFDKKSSGRGVNILLESNEELAEQLHKPIIRNKKKFIQDLKIIFGS